MGFHILVLAGGSGTRLWPLSRRSTPKHLLPLARGGETLLHSQDCRSPIRRTSRSPSLVGPVQPSGLPWASSLARILML